MPNGVTILVTGFGPFGGLRANPSALIVEHLARTAPAHMLCEVLRTEFAAAEQRVRELLREHRPSALIALGVAASASDVRLERQAANLDDARQPDNAGHQPTGTPIVAGGRDALFATLPIQEMFAGVRELGVPVSISDDAGRFVCNHVMYAALDEINRSGLPTRCGFIHVPLCTDLVPAAEEAPSSISLAQTIAVVERCIAIASAEFVAT
jgi:pyroglutamyl-peptidase